MIDQLLLDVQLRSDLSFDNFVEGENSQLLSVLKTLDRHIPSYFIWGSAYSGKTHVLNACCQQYQMLFPQSVVMYLSLGEDYSIDPDCLEGMEQCDLLCLDDIDRVLGQTSWDLALFNLFNRMLDHSKLLVMTSSKPLQELEFSLADLNSRLGSALNFKLHALNADASIAAFLQKAHERAINIDDEVARYIAKRAPRQLEVLLKLLDKIDEETLRTRRAVTVPFIKTIVSW